MKKRLMKLPKISVIFPTYNSEKYLKEALESLLNQTYQDFELIVVDDNSTDKTLEIIKSYGSDKIKIIEGPKMGLAAALNLGIDAANGEYIARMDADDISLPKRFEKQVEFLDSHKDIGLCTVGSEYIGEYSQGNITPWSEYKTPKRIRSAFLFGTAICHPTAMFRKELFREHNIYYNPTFKTSEDIDIWVRALDYTDFGMVPEILFQYRFGDNNGTLQDNGKENFLWVLKNQYKKLFQVDLSETLLKSLWFENDPVVFNMDEFYEIANVYDEILIKAKNIENLDYEYIYIYLFDKVCKFAYLNLDNLKAFKAMTLKCLKYQSQTRLLENKIVNNCRISVVLPTYNSEKYLKEAVDSVLEQTYKDFEIIVVDDGSTDKTLDILNNYKDVRIKVLEGSKKGLSAALNFGIKNAKGEYIARLDSDDVCFPNRFESQLKLMDNNPDLDVCGSFAVLYDERNNNNTIIRNPIDNGMIKAALFFVDPIIHPSVMLRRSTFEKYKLEYDENLKVAEDLELWHRAAGFVKFYNCPTPLLVYRVHGDSSSSIKASTINSVSLDLYRANFKNVLGVDISPDIISAFRPNGGINNKYSLAQIKEIIAKSQLLVEKIKLLPDFCNKDFFSKIILDRVADLEGQISELFSGN